MENIYRWGIDLINWFQQASPSLDLPFILITMTGDQIFYMLFLPLIIWTVNRETGLRLTVFFLICGFINSVAKAIIIAPRPQHFDPSVNAIVKATSGGMPSGHTQNALFVWGYVFKWFQNKVIRIIAIILIILVPISRVYLGVHFPTDLLGGYLLGGILLGLTLKFEDTWVSVISKFGFVQRLILTITIPLLMMLVFPGNSSGQIVICATLFGGGIGIVFSERYLTIQIPDKLGKKIIAYLVGTVILFLIYIGLKKSFDSLEPQAVFRFIRYSLIGFHITFIAPWIFGKIGLVGSRN